MNGTSETDVIKNHICFACINKHKLRIEELFKNSINLYIADYHLLANVMKCSQLIVSFSVMQIILCIL